MNKTLKLKVMKRSLLLLAAMLLGGMTAQAQSVIMYDDYYLKHGTDGHSVETTSSTGFNP